MKKPYILAINGSPHADGIVAELLKSVLDGAERAGAEVKIINLYSLDVEHAPGNYSQNPAREMPGMMPKDGITELYPEILRADGLVFGTPVYWANMSGIMKDFIDRLTPLENDGFQLEGKIAVCIAASKENEGGVEMAAMSMVVALTQMGFHIPPNSVLWYPGGWTTTHAAVESWAKEDAPKAGRNMVKLIELLNHNPIDWSAK